MVCIGTMKLNAINSQIKNNKMHHDYAYLHKQNDFNTVTLDERRKKINDNYNTNRPAQAISFGGSAVSMSEKFIKNKFLNSVMGFVYDNEAAYNAVFSLFVAGMLKPFIVLNMPGSEDKDKQVIATKNFLQAFIGFFLGITISGGIIKKAVDVVNNNLKLIKIDETTRKIKNVTLNNPKLTEIAEDAIIKKHTGFPAKIKNAKEAFSNSSGFKKISDGIVEFFKKPTYTPGLEEVKKKKIAIANAFNMTHKDIFQNNFNFTRKLVSDSNLKDSYNSVWKNIAGTPVAIGKAKVSSLLLPTVVGVLFAKRGLDKTKANKNNANQKNDKSKDNNIKFKQNNSKNISFKGSLQNVVTDGIALNLEKLSMTKIGQSFVKAISSLPGALNKPSARMADLESILITSYWVYNTLKSDKIEPSQKLGLNVHSILVTAVSSTCAFIIDTMLDGLIDKTKLKYGSIVEEIAQSVPENLKQSGNKEELIAFLKEKSADLLNSEKIVKSLSNTDLTNKTMVKESVNKLSATYGKQLSKFKSLTIFTLVVRFLVPVAMVQFSGKLKKKIVEMQKQKEEKANNINK